MSKWSFECPWCGVFFYKKKKFIKHFGVCLEEYNENFMEMLKIRFPTIKL